MKTLLCIPAFNEENIIGDVVRNSLKFVDYVAVCDDGSNDRTSENAETAGAYVIQHTSNKGKGAALQSLFKYAKHHDSEIIVTMDGDGQFVCDEIPLLSKPISDGISDVVIGYRFENNDEMPKYREIGNKLLDKISKLTTDLSLRDTQSGFRAYSKKAIQTIKFSNDGFGADSEILVSASDNGLKISEVKVTVIYNTGYKTSTKNPVSHTSSVVASLIESILIKHPLKFLVIPGLILIIIGIITSSYVLSTFNDYSYFSIPFTLISLGLFSFGLLLILVSGLLFSFNRQLRN